MFYDRPSKNLYREYYFPAPEYHQASKFFEAFSFVTKTKNLNVLAKSLIFHNRSPLSFKNSKRSISHAF
jgi:hypothetical protein